MSVLRPIVNVVGLLLVAYACMLAFLYVNQRSMLFFPHFTRDPVAAADIGLEVEGATLKGWVVNPGQARALLYFGGNAEDISRSRSDVARWASGHTVYLMAYRGYGFSSGEPSEAALVADAIALFDHVAGSYGQVDLLGRSLGTGVAVQLAAARPVGRMGLITPFDSVLRIGQQAYPWVPVRWLLKDPFESWRWAPMLDLPVLIVIAGRDTIVPPERAKALAAALPVPPTVVHLPEAGHVDVQDAPGFDAALRRFFAASPHAVNAVPGVPSVRPQAVESP